MTDDPVNAHIPTINKQATLRGVTIAFLILGFFALLLRIVVRLRARLWGWDDYFVVLSGISTAIGSILGCTLPDPGWGLHMVTVKASDIVLFYKHVWMTNNAYIASTALIKLAILFQYLRLFDSQNRTPRLISKALCVVIALWGAISLLLAIFACKPISRSWNWTLPGKCVAWGNKNPDVIFATWAAHAGLNMFFDVLIFLLPIPFLNSMRMQGRTRMGLIGVFIIGAVIVTVSIARMIALCMNRAGTAPHVDMTYAVPTIYIFSILEINIAILCASIPVFWPFVSSLSLNKILVVNEIEVRTDRRESQGIALTEHNGFVGIPDLEMENNGRVSRTSKSSMLGGSVKEYSVKDSKFSRSASKLIRYPSGRPSHTHNRSDSSTHTYKKGYSTEISTTRRSSHESQRNLAHRSSNGDISATSSLPNDTEFPTEPPRNGSVTHYQDGYVQDWVVPDFQGKEVGNGKGGVTTTVARAPIPFDHIEVHEREKR